MEVLVKTTVALALLPAAGVAIAPPTFAQTVVPTSPITQITTPDEGIVTIHGGTQAEQNIFHSFDQFTLEQNQTANFVTPADINAVIGQVIGGTASSIDGLLQVTGSNADLYLVNPAGLIFGPHARLDLGGSFTATTATHLGDGTQWFDVLSDPDYRTLVTPPSHFGFSRSSAVINQGQLTVPDGQSLRLLAPQIVNSGTLAAPSGEVTLLTAGIGQTIQLPSGLLSLELSQEPEVVSLLPTLITGGDLNHSNDLVINNHGEVALVDSHIAPESHDTPTLTNTGNISARGNTGGDINLLGTSIRVHNSLLDASGSQDGGSIHIGGGWQGQGPLPRASQTTITKTVNITADSTQTGNGGQVIIWSDGITSFDGHISAQAANGDGGFVETSGLDRLILGENTSVTTHAPQGTTGLWMIDPTDLSVVDSGGTATISPDQNDAVSDTINAATVVSALDRTNVMLQATNSITVDATIDASGNSSSNSLFIDTNILNLNEHITLKGDGQLSGTATTVNVGEHGRIQNGVDAVADGGTVNLATAVYREGQIITLDHSLNLTGQGKDSTFISGDSDNNGQGNHQVFNITDRGNNINIAALTIQDGHSVSDGAGLRNDGSNVVISDTRFINNNVVNDSQDGGAIHNRGSLTITDSSFENNRTDSDGGAIDILQGSVEIFNSRFINNQAADHGGAIDVDPNGELITFNTEFIQNSAGTHGGAIFSEGLLNVDTASFSHNSAVDQGGALFVDNLSEIRSSSFLSNSAQSGGGIANWSELSLIDSIVSDNRATGRDKENGGGGLYNTVGGSATIDASLVSNNFSASSGGGILNLAFGSLTEVAIANSVIAGNQALTKGGGIEIASHPSLPELSQLTINNSTVSGNQAATGGGIRTVGPTTITNVTITDNRATNAGGGLSENRTTAAIPSLLNNIVAANYAPSNPDVDGHFQDRGNNLIGIDQGSTGFQTSSLVGTISSPIDPGLTPLTVQSGALPSHYLLSESPAANTGNSSVTFPTDQNGNPRIVGGSIDLGAIESGILPSTSSLSDAPKPAQPQFATPIAQNQLGPNASAEILRRFNESNVFPQEQELNPALAADMVIKSRSPGGRARYFDEEAFQYLEDTFSKEYEDYWHLPRTPPTTLQSTQKTLQQAAESHQTQSAVIYAVFVTQQSDSLEPTDRFMLSRSGIEESPDDQLLLVAISGNGEPIQHLVNVSRAEIVRQAKLFRLAVSDPQDPISYKALARQFYGWLLAPVQAELAEYGITNIMYSLDRGLRTVPLAAMMQHDSFVIEHYGISVIPSMGLTQSLFDGSPSLQKPLVAGAHQFQTLDTLQAVPIELDVVAKAIHADDVLLNERFTLSNLLNLRGSQQSDLLHLATHAEFNAGDVNQSFIQLWNEQLTFEQMKELDWSALELLILSACSTALSSPEAELGFTGLATATGAETSMGSLWNVSDLGTLALMSEFYEQLAHTPLRFAALQQAQLSLIHGNTQIQNHILHTSQSNISLPAEWELLETFDFSHPFYWAGFTLVGNPWY